MTGLPLRRRALARADPAVAALIDEEAARQADRIELMASENYVSRAVREAEGSCLINSTVEGYPGARFHGEQPVADSLETLAIERAKELFGYRYANVQPHSGTQANQAVLLGLVPDGGRVLAMGLAAGGHFSHGHATSLAGRLFDIVHYGVRESDGLIDYDDVDDIAKRTQPDILIAGGAAYPRRIDFRRLRQIADSVGCILMADIAHLAGLVAVGLFPNPFPHCHVVTTTTYKNLRGPRGGLILCNDEDIAQAIDAAIIPLLQGTPLLNVIAAKAVCFHEATTPAFTKYARAVRARARQLASDLSESGLRIVGGGTDTPLVIVDLRPLGLGGAMAANCLARAGIGTNAIFVPGDPDDLSRLSGIRFGVSACCTRGFGRSEFGAIAEMIAALLETLARDPNGVPALERGTLVRVRALCRSFPLDAGNADEGIKTREGEIYA